jgi:hypothetical protein
LLAAAGLTCDASPEAPGASLLLQSADGSYELDARLEARSLRGAARGATGDLDGDGSPDLVLVGDGIEYRLDLASGKPLLETTVDRDGLAVAIANVKGDPRAEVLVLSSPRSLLILEADDGDMTILDDVTTQAGACAVTAADLDADGVMEVLVAGPGGLFVHRQEGDAFLPAEHQVNGGPGCTGPGTALALGDLTSDGTLDAAMLVERDRKVRVVTNDGLGGLGGPTDFALPDTPTGLGIVDANEDGRADLVVGTLTRVFFVPQADDGPSGEPVLLADATEVRVVADMDGDGLPELLAVDEASNQLVAWSGGVGDWSSTSTPFDLEPDFTDLLVTDADGDGRVDVLAISHGNRGCGQ